MLVFVMNVCESSSQNSVMDQIFVDPFIKSRRKDCEQEVYKYDNAHAESRQIHFDGDRFIPRRVRRETTERNLKYIGKTVEKDILKTSMTVTSNYWRQNTFFSAINHVFDVRERRLLEFGILPSPPKECKNHINMDGDWPCRPRLRPSAYPDATHDLPEFYNNFDFNLMDWSSSDQMAVSFGQDVIVWRNKEDTTMVFSVNLPRALKYSPDGKYLAIGCTQFNYPVLELWEVQEGREFLVSEGSFFHKYIEAICCIEWSKDSKEIVCGTQSGLIIVQSQPELTTVCRIYKHKIQLSIMRFSPTMLYLATGDIEGNIYIFDGRTYQVKLRLGTKFRHGVTFDWHPWTGVDLAVSERTPASIFIFHVPRREIVAYYQRKDKKIEINSINFSQITGELLVSISRRDEQGCPYWEILVLSSLNRVVDIMGNPDRGSRFMMWSPDGTKVATAGLDESICIWNFIPGHKKYLKSKRQQRANAKDSKLKLYVPIR